MPDTIDQAAASAPLANPVIPNDAFAAAARAAMTNARSPLEAAAERTAAQPAPHQQPTYDPFNRPAVQHLDTPALSADGLATARNADNQRGQAAVEPPAKPAAAAEEPADPSVANEPWKQHKRPKGQRATSADWDAVKANHAAELADLRKQLDAARGNGHTDITKHPDYVKVSTERAEYLDTLKQVAVERDPDFKARFDTRRDAIMATIRGLSGNAREDIEAILELRAGPARDKALGAALSTFQPTTQATLMGHLTALAQVDAERAGELASRKASFDTNQQQLASRQQQASRDREAKLTAALDKQLAAWTDPEEGHPLLVKRDNDDKWNSRVEKRIALARSIFAGESDLVSLSQASLKAAAHDDVLQMAFEATQEVERLTAQLARFNGISTSDSGLAASIMTNGSNDATLKANPFDARYVNHFASSLEEARKADYAAGGGGAG